MYITESSTDDANDGKNDNCNDDSNTMTSSQNLPILRLGRKKDQQTVFEQISSPRVGCTKKN